jgi:hypothetical protein
MRVGVGTRCVQQGEGEKPCQHPLFPTGMETDFFRRVPVYGGGGGAQPISMPLGAVRSRLSRRP